MSAHLSNDPKERNHQLLEIIGKKLSKIHSFVESSNKLANWASDSRAYYDDVKETIIKLLERALLTVLNELGLDPRAPFNIHHYLNKPYIGAYKNLVQTVYRFRDKFPRDGLHLQSRLQAVYMTTTPLDRIIDLDATNSSNSVPIVHSSGPKSSPPASSNSSSFTSTLHPPRPLEALPPPTPLLLTPPSSVVAKHILPSLQSDVTPSIAMLPISNSKPVNSSTPNLTPSLNSSSMSKADDLEPSLAGPSPPPKPPNASLPPDRRQSDEFITKPRKKKRKKLNLSEMLDLDQEDQIRAPSELPTPVVLNETHFSKDVETRALDASAVPSSSAEPVTRIPDMQDGSIIGVKRVRSNSTSSNPTDRPLNFNLPNLPYLFDRAPVLQSPASSDRTKPEPSPSVIQTQPTEESSSGQVPASSQAESHNSGEAHSVVQTIVQSVENKENHSANAKDAMEVDSQPVKNNVLEDVIDLNNDFSQVEGIVEVPLTTSNEMLPAASDETKFVDTSFPANTLDAPPPTMAINDFSIAKSPTIATEMKIHKVSLPKSSGFSKTLTTRQQAGLKQTAHFTMRFTIDEAQFSSIENWNNRKNSPISEDRKDILCFSLACYHRVDVEKHSTNYNALKSRWPKRQRLDLQVTKRDGTTKTIPLGPPTACTPDGLVDLGPFIKRGENTIIISQKGDLSAHVFCLHVHEPTLAQIERFNKALDDDLEWVNWCKSVSSPLVLQPSNFSTQSLLNVI